MAPPAGSLASPRLSRLARRAPPEAQAERCEMCSEPIAPDHRHLLELDPRRLVCACRACSLLFDRPPGANARYRLVPQRRLSLERFDLSDELWARLALPVDMAFFFHSSVEGRVVALYPGPMGATESQLGLDAWSEIEEANPVLAGIEPDVEALLVNRSRGARRHWLVPIDDCYRLVAVIRTGWRGLSGGSQVWREIEGFFEQLRALSRPPGEATSAQRAEGS
jgi:hypothetical protein